MSVADSFIGCLKKNVHSKIPSSLMSSFKDGLLIELDKNGGNLNLNDFLEFLKGFSLNLKKQTEKKIIGDLSNPKDQKWWADVLGMDLSDLGKEIVRDYEAIFIPGKKKIFPIGQIQDKVIGLKDCLNKELELNKPKPQDSPLSDVSSPYLSYESEPEPEPEPEPVPMKRKEEVRMDPHDEKMYTRREFIENYGDTDEWDAAKYDHLNLLKNKVWTYKSLGLGRNKKTKKRKKKTKKTKKKKTKKKKTKKRIKR